MLLTVLGCSGSVPGPHSAASGYLVESTDTAADSDTAADTARLVVDLGNGTLAELLGRRDAFAVDALLFSHLHPDHCADFGALTVLRRYHPAPPCDPRAHRLPVHGPSDAHARLAAAYAPNRTEAATTDLSDVYDFLPYTGDAQDVAGFTVTAALVDHPCEAYGLRIEHAGRSLCFTGDTGPCDALVRLADGVDTLLSEACWTDGPDRPAHLHLSGRQAGELATKAGVGRLVVTHVPPWTDKAAVFAEARAAFTGDVVLAEQGATYRI